MRAEFEAELTNSRGMSAEALARAAIAGIERGRPEIRPGIAGVLKAGAGSRPSSCSDS